MPSSVSASVSPSFSPNSKSGNLSLSAHDEVAVGNAQYFRLYSSDPNPVVMVSGGTLYYLGRAGSETVTEILTFTDSKAASLSKVPSGTVSVSPVGAFYDAAGKKIPTPALTVNTDSLEVLASTKVFGAVTVSYAAAYTIHQIAFDSLGNKAVVFATSLTLGLTSSLTLAHQSNSVATVTPPKPPAIVIDRVDSGWLVAPNSQEPLPYFDIMVFTRFTPTLQVLGGRATFLGTKTGIKTSEVLSYSNSYSATVSKPVTSQVFSGDYQLIGDIVTPAGAVSGMSYYIRHDSSYYVGAWYPDGDGSYPLQGQFQTVYGEYIIEVQNYALPITASVLMSYETRAYMYRITHDVIGSSILPVTLAAREGSLVGTLVAPAPSNKETS